MLKEAGRTLVSCFKVMREKCANKGKGEAEIEAKQDRGETLTPERKVREEISTLIKTDTDIKGNVNDMSNVTYKH